MKTVLCNFPYLGGVGAVRWIAAAWIEGFKQRGYVVHTCDESSNLADRCREIQPDILYCDIAGTRIEEEACRALILEMRARGTKVVMNVYWPMTDQPLNRVEALHRYNLADLYCGEREPDSMSGFTTFVGKPYVTIPQFANPRFHYPVKPNRKFAYDIAFVGAKLPHKRWFNERILGELQKRYRVGLFGPYWTLGDNALRVLSKGARIAGIVPLALMFDRSRVSLSEEEEACLYSSSKILLNFHEREPDNSQPHHIVNQRTFKIAACGGFQIVDPVKALGKYFSSDEIVTAGFDPGDWFKKIDHYLKHEDERKSIQRRATDRALREHMAQNRVEFLEKLLGIAPRP